MASKSLELEDCPLCQKVVTDPIVLSCSHSFCNVCLTNWREKNEGLDCPLCKRRSSKAEPPYLCLLHSEPLEFYCVEHEQPVCAKCETSENHQGHTFRAIDEAAEQHKKELGEGLQVLRLRLKAYTDLEMKCDQVSGHIEVQAQRTERQIQEEFKRLRQVLQEEEETRIRALREEKEQKSQRMKEKTEAVSKEIEALKETIQSTEDDLRHEHVSFLHKHKAAVERVQQRSPLEDPQLGSGALIDQAKHLGNLGFNIWNNMKDQVSYSPVLLDPNTVGPRLSLSEDLTSVTPGKKYEVLPDNPERINAKFYQRSVMGSEAFDSGTHSWEVDVKDNMNWQLGVATTSTEEPGKFEEMWGIWFSGNGYKLWTGPKSKSLPLSIEEVFQRIRVNLDFDQGELSFYDADSNTIIHAVTQTFTGKTLTPYFFTETFPELKILPLKVEVTLK